MSSDVKKRTIAQLRRAKILGNFTDIIEISSMISDQFTPTVDPFVEIVVEKNPRQGVVFTQPYIGLQNGSA